MRQMALSLKNFAFNVTSTANITAIIPERGVIERPTAHKILKHFANKKGLTSF
jgi:methylthioribose-1-phosphate isomerase